MNHEIAFVNATVHTVDDHDTVARGVLVRRGRIVVVGSVEEVLGAAGPDCRVHDVAGQTVVPGFIDPHNHLSLTALEGASIDCYPSAVSSIDELLTTIHEACEQAVPGQWVRGVGLAPGAMKEGRGPTRQELDEAAPANPLFLLDITCNCAFANSAALASCGIDQHSSQPWGGRIVFDQHGRPTGELHQAALNPLQTASWNAVATTSWDTTVESLHRKMKEYLEVGLTGICDPAITPDFAEMYARADRAGTLPFTVQQLHTSDDFFGRQDVRRNDWLTRVRAEETERLRGGSMKMFVDHVFVDGPGLDKMVDGCRVHTGSSYYNKPEVEQLAVAAHRAGIPTAIHAMGNCAVDTVLDAYQSVRTLGNDAGLLRIEHAHVIDPAQAPRMAALGVDVVAKPGNLVPFGPAFVQDWKGTGQDHLSVMPIRSMLEAGVRVSIGSDAPCASWNPIENMWSAVSRLAYTGEQINPDEAITALQALRCATINAAHAAGRASEEGSIEVGKRANLVVLTKDPLACATEQMPAIGVVMTVVDGVVVHALDSAPPAGTAASLIV